MRHVTQDLKKDVQFEYETLPSEQRVLVLALTLEIKDNLQKTVHTIWQIGKNLVEVRKQIELWQFTSWLKLEFDWSRSTAYNFISVYEAFPELSHPKFGRLNISISALYLLAAPSTQPEIRLNFLTKALEGKQITHKEVQKSIKEDIAQNLGIDGGSTASITPMIDLRYESNVIIDLQQARTPSAGLELSDTEVMVENLELATTFINTANMQKSLCSDTTYVAESLCIRPAWNLIKHEFSLFWGDTMSPRFHDRLPKNAIILAIPSLRWHHDWLANGSRRCITISLPQLEYKLIERLLLALSLGEEALVFPWLPDWKIIELVLSLNLKVYAGDPALNRCEQVVMQIEPNQRKISNYQK
jgi:Protein of unknown function (DUF3102)